MFKFFVKVWLLCMIVLVGFGVVPDMLAVDTDRHSISIMLNGDHDSVFLYTAIALGVVVII